MKPFEYIKNFVNVKLSPSKIHGIGVFAMKDINIGESIFVEWEGKSGLYSITETELNSLDEIVKYHILDMCSFKLMNGKHELVFFLNNGCHWIFKTPLHWVNSCAYNETPNIDAHNLTTLSKIKKGEELFSKYGKYFKNTHIKIF